MSAELAEFYVHTVGVETLVGTGAYGDVYEPPATVACLIEEKRKYVRSATGEMIVSETTIWAGPEHYDAFKPDSMVTANGHRSKVITRSLADSQELDLPDHVGVFLE